MTDTYESLAAELQATDTNFERRATDLAIEMMIRERAVANAQQRLDNAVVFLKEVKERDLPNMMQAAGQDDFSFTDPHDGIKYKIKITDTVYASIPKEIDDTGRKANFDWLREIGQGASIKKQFVVACDLLPDDKIAMIQSAVKLAAPTVSTKIEEGVHASTLSAIVRREMEKKDAKPIPTTIKVSPKFEATATAKKAK